MMIDVNELRTWELKSPEALSLVESNFLDATICGIQDILFELLEYNPAFDFGSPGAIVHFLEKYPAGEHISALYRSVRRCPTEHTLWILNRQLNGLDDDSVGKKEGVQLMRNIVATSDNRNLVDCASEFLEDHEE